MTARLVVSLSGLAGSTLDAARDLTAELDARAVPLAQLLTPHGSLDAPVTDWLTGRLGAGDELVLHGFRPPQRSGQQRPGRLAAHEAGLQLIAARAAVHALGPHPRCFAPNRWLASAGTLSTLRRNGFRACAELHGVRDLDSERLLSGRLLGFGRRRDQQFTGRQHSNQHSTGRPGRDQQDSDQHGSGRRDHTRAEPWRCLAVVLAAGRTARRGGLVRLAVHAADLRRPAIRQAVLDAVDIALHHGAEPGTHAALLPPPLPRQRQGSQSSVASSRSSTVNVVPSGPRLSNMP